MSRQLSCGAADRWDGGWLPCLIDIEQNDMLMRQEQQPGDMGPAGSDLRRRAGPRPAILLSGMLGLLCSRRLVGSAGTDRRSWLRNRRSVGPSDSSGDSMSAVSTVRTACSRRPAVRQSDSASPRRCITATRIRNRRSPDRVPSRLRRCMKALRRRLNLVRYSHEPLHFAGVRRAWVQVPPPSRTPTAPRRGRRDKITPPLPETL
jgi:hypothetical protein